MPVIRVSAAPGMPLGSRRGKGGPSSAERSSTPIELNEQNSDSQPKSRRPGTRLKESESEQLEDAEMPVEMFKRARVRASKAAVVIVLSFVTCWAPFYSLQLVSFLIAYKYENNGEQISSVTCKLLKLFNEWSYTLGLLNALINPIVYGHYDFNTKFQWLR